MSAIYHYKDGKSVRIWDENPHMIGEPRKDPTWGVPSSYTGMGLISEVYICVKGYNYSASFARREDAFDHMGVEDPDLPKTHVVKHEEDANNNLVVRFRRIMNDIVISRSEDVVIVHPNQVDGLIEALTDLKRHLNP